MTAWVAVVAAGVVTYLLRLLPGLVLSARETPDWLVRAGGWIAPVAFAAIGATAVVGTMPRHGIAWLPQTVSLVVAAVIAVRTHRTGLTVACGLATLWLLSGLLALARML